MPQQRLFSNEMGRRCCFFSGFSIGPDSTHPHRPSPLPGGALSACGMYDAFVELPLSNCDGSEIGRNREGGNRTFPRSTLPLDEWCAAAREAVRSATKRGRGPGEGVLRAPPLVRSLPTFFRIKESRGLRGLSAAQREKVYVFEEIEVKRWVIPA